METDSFYKTVYRPQLDVSIELDERYVESVLKGPERHGCSRLHRLSTHGYGNYGEDKLPMFILVVRRTSDCYVLRAKFGDESTIRFLLSTHEEK